MLFQRKWQTSVLQSPSTIIISGSSSYLDLLSPLGLPLRTLYLFSQNYFLRRVMHVSSPSQPACRFIPENRHQNELLPKKQMLYHCRPLNHNSGSIFSMPGGSQDRSRMFDAKINAAAAVNVAIVAALTKQMTGNDDAMKTLTCQRKRHETPATDQ